jgi:hypothetical protein
VHRLDPAEQRTWREATSGVTQRLIAAIGGRAAEVYAVIQRGKADYVRSRSGAESAAWE